MIILATNNKGKVKEIKEILKNRRYKNTKRNEYKYRNRRNWGNIRD